MPMQQQNSLFPFDASADGLPSQVLKTLSKSRTTPKKKAVKRRPELDERCSVLLAILVLIDGQASLDDLIVGAYRVKGFTFNTRSEAYYSMGKLLSGKFAQVELSKNHRHYVVAPEYKTSIQTK
jgi:hypothetical protein